MSMSLKNAGRWLYFAAVPLACVAGTSVAVWLAVFSYTDSHRQRISLPVFDYSAAKGRLPVEEIAVKSREPVQHVRDFFQTDTVAGKQELTLDFQKIALGMVIVKNDKRFCLTNGIQYGEGQGGSIFTVHRIEPNGVWYLVGMKKIFLQTGEKVNVDGDGNVREWLED